jgi:hypothetical protein
VQAIMLAKSIKLALYIVVLSVIAFVALIVVGEKQEKQVDKEEVITINLE